MSRLERIRRNWPDHKLLELPGVAKAQVSANRVFETAVSADPTKQKKMVGWILKSWQNKGLLWEDIRAGNASTIHQTLHDFNRLNKFITKPDGTPDIEARSLMKYQTPGDLWLVIKDALVREQEEGETLSGKAQKEKLKLKARVESYHEKFESGLVIDIPFTKFSSKINGRNTRWCTAADHDNAFEEYAKTGPLVIMTLPSGQRYQYHVDIIETIDYSEIPDTISDIEEDDEIPYADDIIARIFQHGHFTIMDEADNTISPKDKEHLRPYLSEIVPFLAKLSADMVGEYIMDDEHNSIRDYVNASRDFISGGITHFIDNCFGTFDTPIEKTVVEGAPVITPEMEEKEKELKEAQGKWFTELQKIDPNDRDSVANVYGILQDAANWGYIEGKLDELMIWTNKNRDMLARYKDETPSSDPDSLTVLAYQFVCSLIEYPVPLAAISSATRLIERYRENPTEDLKKGFFASWDILNSIDPENSYDIKPYAAKPIKKKDLAQFSDEEQAILRITGLADAPYAKTTLANVSDVLPPARRIMARFSHYAGTELPLDVLEKMAVDELDVGDVDKIESAIDRVHIVMLKDDVLKTDLLRLAGEKKHKLENVQSIILEQKGYVDSLRTAVSFRNTTGVEPRLI